jgi:glutamate-1-semialdehyde aminotransferase
LTAGTRSGLYRRALDLIPGGVNSPVRAMRAVGRDEPLFARSASGAYLEDTNGNRYVDWVMSWGPLLFGHADPETVRAVREAAGHGTSFGLATEAEVKLAAEIVDAVPSVEKVRLVSSGTEAAMSTIRLARAFTARDRILKFAGCYHGHVDALLADACGALLVFDEVITGFRVARGGAQELYGVEPDLTILGKIVGGGLPLAAFGGRADVMDRLAPAGDVYQAGTLAGNPLATAAGLAVLRRLDETVYATLEERGRRLEQGLAAYGRVQRVGAMATLFMTAAPVRDFDDAGGCDTERYAALFRHLLSRGIYVAPSQFEAMFVSLSHGDEEIDRTIEAVAEFDEHH